MFDKIIERKGTDSFKWDMNTEYFGREDVIPMWVADMDFACAEPIVKAVQERAKHPVFGYTVRKEDYYDAVLGWLDKGMVLSVRKNGLCFHRRVLYMPYG